MSLTLAGGVADGIGEIETDLISRINENISLVASAKANTKMSWEVMAGVSIEF